MAEEDQYDNQRYVLETKMLLTTRELLLGPLQDQLGLLKTIPFFRKAQGGLLSPTPFT